MIQKNEKIKKGGRRQNIIFSILIGVFFFAIIGFLIISNLKISQKRGEMFSQIEELNREIQILEERNERLRAELLEAETDFYWEEKLRQQGYKRPGEEAIVIIPSAEEKEKTAGEEKESFWEKLLQKIGF